MLNCPECGKKMGWMGDNDTMEDEVYETHMTCNDCHIDLFKMWGNGVKEVAELKLTDDKVNIATLPYFIPKPVKTFEVDYSKVETIDDIINVLIGMNIRYSACEEDIPYFFRRYLKECDKL
jgi:hypothetical protein